MWVSIKDLRWPHRCINDHYSVIYVCSPLPDDLLLICLPDQNVICSSFFKFWVLIIVVNCSNRIISSYNFESGFAKIVVCKNPRKKDNPFKDRHLDNATYTAVYVKCPPSNFLLAPSKSKITGRDLLGVKQLPSPWFL